MVIANLMRQLWLPDLIRVNKDVGYGLQEWLLTGDYLISNAPSKAKIELFPRDIGNVVEAISYDLARYSTAAFESIEGLKPHAKLPFQSGWILIRSYYAAYFAANAIMRCFGFACANLDIRQINTIKDTARICGYATSGNKKSPDPGVFFVLLDTNSNSLTLSVASSREGVHGKFWQCFSMFLTDLELKIKSSSVLLNSDKSKARAEISLLRNAITFPGTTPNKLSSIRNNINYKLAFNVWHPYTGCHISAQSIIDTLNTLSSCSPNTDGLKHSKDEITDLINTSGFLVAWCKESIQTISDASRSQRQLLKQRPIAFLNEVNI